DARKMLNAQSTMRMFLKISDHLNRLLPSGASIAFSEIGSIAYYTPKLHWLDTDGLMDREIAQLETATHGNIGVITRDFTAPATPVGQVLL
ncbi:hypothetical protein, partial [Mesorhizobium sp. M1A.T.Ca.IN.004.03.1.1]|uniref:hypothetical protein n=1 Tax=Mesorhizobium sp. M1A.T.Ca.IN.004.03.1.1 TaxID=2496795 RepID=UPI0013E3A9BF